MGKIHDGMFTSRKHDWATPQEFFDRLHREFAFTIDCCAVEANAKCARYITPEQDALSLAWDGTVWMNPPYGNGIAAWIEKAWRSAQEGATVVCLIPTRADTAWWHDYVMQAAEVRLVRGRLQFGGHAERGHNAPFPCSVVVFRPPVPGLRRGGPLFLSMDARCK